MRCPNCLKRKAIIDSQYGVTFCEQCRLEENTLPRIGYEFSTNGIKDQRREYAKDIIAPYRDGVFSDEYYQEYGTQGVEVTKEQIENRREVWKDIKGRWNRDKSKGGKHK